MQYCLVQSRLLYSAGYAKAVSLRYNDKYFVKQAYLFDLLRDYLAAVAYGRFQ
jgi:hypothetical protein